ncbi:helix-turn-helix domain-containing protein [Pseudomonas sp. Irchel 3A5]|uniref:helix-turn-helix domain-containing protein n=1 Tax=Pseudomonas sp. Irchel 3A5 TaxID=2008911 RepID=UPI000BA4A532|nr:helix-turn-helix domain-containing protein [Pseudomonas sp. Irchel 3A5]
MRDAVAESVPVFKLYGETALWPTPDLLHCESIPERSQLHGWEIQTHSHSDLVQLLYVQSGQATLHVEGVTRQVESAALQVIPALSVHRFSFSPDIQGYILSLAQPLAEQLSAALASPALSTAHCHGVDSEQRKQLDPLFASISDEYAQHKSGRDSMLHALVTLLSIWLDRRSIALSSSAMPSHEKGREHLQAFTRLVGEQFRQHWSIEHYAEQLNISAAWLNSLCRRLTDQSALQIINQRLLLEARRDLVYTTLTINQISDRLGFSEPAYFSRFFKRCTGQSPRQFRGQR